MCRDHTFGVYSYVFKPMGFTLTFIVETIPKTLEETKSDMETSDVSWPFISIKVLFW